VGSSAVREPVAAWRRFLTFRDAAGKKGSSGGRCRYVPNIPILRFLTPTVFLARFLFGQTIARSRRRGAVRCSPGIETFLRLLA
jgi:hypothetical protein